MLYVSLLGYRTSRVLHLITSGCFIIGRSCAAGVSVPKEATYDDFVRISKEIMRGRSTQQQQEVVLKVLASLLPEQAPAGFRCAWTVPALVVAASVCPLFC